MEPLIKLKESTLRIVLPRNDDEKGGQEGGHVCGHVGGSRIELTSAQN